jgi:hypothetical protein
MASISSFFTYQPTGQYFGSTYAFCQGKFLLTGIHNFLMDLSPYEEEVFSFSVVYSPAFTSIYTRDIGDFLQKKGQENS